MGCDIHTFVERRQPGGHWERVSVDMGRDRYENDPFGWRSYGMFGFLAGVRNYSAVPPISASRGLPKDTSVGVLVEWDKWGMYAHSASWLTLAELLAFDYEAEFEDRRVTRGIDGGARANPGEGTLTTFREFLGEELFSDLGRLETLGDPKDTRIVFWFDN